MTKAYSKFLRDAEGPKVIEMIGLSMFGSRWQTELGKAVGVNSRTVRRWISGESPISNEVMERLQEVCEAKITELIDRKKLIIMYQDPYWPGLKQFEVNLRDYVRGWWRT